MKFKLSDKTSRFAKRTLADFSERMMVMLADMSLEEISVQKICDICNVYFVLLMTAFHSGRRAGFGCNRTARAALRTKEHRRF